MTPVEYAILSLLVLSVPVLIFGYFVLRSAKKKVLEAASASPEGLVRAVVKVAQSSESVREADLIAGHSLSVLSKLNGKGLEEFHDLLKQLADYRTSKRPKLLQLEINRLREYLESNDYEKNRIGIYAYDSAKDSDLKEPAERVLSKLAREYPNHDDPDHLIEIGKRASLSIAA